MKPPQLKPEASVWQLLIVDSDGRWVHMRMDTLLMASDRRGVTAHIAAEAESAAERLLKNRTA